jgi:hypothetical protein
MELCGVGPDCAVRFRTFIGYFVGGMGENRNMNGGDLWQPCTAPKKTASELAWPAEWQRLRQAIVGALASFPEARAAVVEAIRSEAERDEDKPV